MVERQGVALPAKLNLQLSNDAPRIQKVCQALNEGQFRTEVVGPFLKEIVTRILLSNARFQTVLSMSN